MRCFIVLYQVFFENQECEAAPLEPEMKNKGQKHGTFNECASFTVLHSSVFCSSGLLASVVSAAFPIGPAEREGRVIRQSLDPIKHSEHLVNVRLDITT